MEITRTAETENKNEEGVSDTSSKVPAYEPFDGLDEADKEAGKTENIVKTAAEERLSPVDFGHVPVKITLADKNAYLDAVVSGDRFYRTVPLFNGRVEVTFRSRSLAETEAILSYMQRHGMAGDFTTQSSVQDASLLCLLVAQVKKLNGVEYQEMAEPLNATESLDGVEPPAWEKDIEIWRSKPPALLSAIGDALVEFESKYWTMTQAAKDENFWNPDGSIEK